MQTRRIPSTPTKAVARSRAQRDGVEYQAPSTLTSARELISTVIGSHLERRSWQEQKLRPLFVP
jgi:hypothetical protein